MDKRFKDLFYEKLLLGEVSFKEQSAFLLKMTAYLEHGRSIDFVEEKINKLLEFLYALGLGTKEAIKILTAYPAILNTVGNLYEKYLFLGYIENLDNTVRINKLLNSPRDFMIGLNKMYARFRVITDSGYGIYNWNNLVHASDREFCKIFVKGTYDKPYQIFDNELEVLDYLSRVDTKKLDMSSLKEMVVNEELVSNYEGKGKKH